MAAWLTLCFGTDQAGRRITEGTQYGTDGQAQVLVARIQRHRGKAQVGQAWSFLRTNLDVRDLGETDRNEM